MSRNEIILAVVCAVLVVFSLTVAIVVPKRNPDFPGRKMGAFFLVSMVLVAGMLISVQFFGEEEEAEQAEAAVAAESGAAETGPAESGAAETGAAETGAAETGAGAPPAAPPGDPAAGREIFDSAGCGGCHTLADAGSNGSVGPNLDDAKPPYDLVIDRVTNGKGVMPAFSGQLSEQQIQDVAAYVVQATG